MQVVPEVRNSGRFGHEYIIKLEGDLKFFHTVRYPII